MAASTTVAAHQHFQHTQGVLWQLSTGSVAAMVLPLLLQTLQDCSSQTAPLQAIDGVKLTQGGSVAWCNEQDEQYLCSCTLQFTSSCCWFCQCY